MKTDTDVVILAGGKGIRMGKVVDSIPKPLVRIGDMPILEHIMMIYSHFGYKKFTLLLGHKGGMILDYFAERRHDWDISFEFTGTETDTAERLWKVREKLRNTFFLSYADVLADVNLRRMLNFHRKNQRVGTMAIVPLRTDYGVTKVSGNIITKYTEKPRIRDTWVNGGFMVLEPKVFDYYRDSDKDFSRTVLVRLAEKKLMCAFKHSSFWMGMDTFKEHALLDEMWRRGDAKWMIWKKRKSGTKSIKARSQNTSDHVFPAARSLESSRTNIDHR